MKNKAEILIHPVRIKILQVLIRNKESGLTPLEMVKALKDVSQATLYRHLQVLLDADIIYVKKEKKVRAVSEKYYAVNEEEMKLNQMEWGVYSIEEKLNYISFYQLTLLTQYEDYLRENKEKGNEDKSTFSLIDLKLNDKQLEHFQSDLNQLMLKYYHMTKEEQPDAQFRTVGLTIIPET